MRELLETYDTWRSSGLGVGRAVVVRTFGSAPRGEGAVLLVSENGQMIGSVSGGCVEAAAADEVLRARATGHSRVIRYGISDEQAWDVGLACGGTIDVLIEPEVTASLVAAARAESATVATLLPEPVPPPELDPFVAGEGGPPRQPVVVASGAADPGDLPAIVAAAARQALATGRSALLEAEGRAWFLEAFPARPRLVIVGATEVARHLVGLARALGYVTVVADPRAAFAAKARFPEVDTLLVAWPDDAFAELRLGQDDAVAVLSHDPKIDEPAIVEAFRRGARYVGAVGSRRSQAARRERLIAAGLQAEDLTRLRGPIGLDLGGREPPETALAIAAEVVATRRGGTGAPLRDARGRITSDRG